MNSKYSELIKRLAIRKKKKKKKKKQYCELIIYEPVRGPAPACAMPLNIFQSIVADCRGPHLHIIEFGK
jgi:hypothetical protein